MRLLFATDIRSIPLLIVRVTLGLVIFPHGAQKLLGWFGGSGFSGTMDFMTGNFGLPWVAVFLVVVAEFFGALGLITGLLTRISAAGIAAVMLGAIVMVHAEHGFFMNWQGGQAGEGYEYHVLAIGLAVAALVGGGGRFALDSLIVSRVGGAHGSRETRAA